MIIISKVIGHAFKHHISDLDSPEEATTKPRKQAFNRAWIPRGDNYGSSEQAYLLTKFDFWKLIPSKGQLRSLETNK